MKNNNFLYLGIFTFFTVAAWVGFDLYHISISSTIPENMKQDVVPLNPALDLKIFKNIKEKKKPAEFAEGSASASTAILPEPESTQSAEL